MLQLVSAEADDDNCMAVQEHTRLTCTYVHDRGWARGQSARGYYRLCELCLMSGMRLLLMAAAAP